MQKFTQKYTIITLLETMPEGTEYDWRDWPLHVTLADIFAVDWQANTLGEKLEDLLKGQEPFTAEAKDDIFFGPQQDVRVTVIQKTESLITLHYALVRLLKTGNVTFNNPQFVEKGFVPHCTVQKHSRLHKGDVVHFREASIIDMFPHSDPYRRKLLKTIQFLGE